MWAFFFWEGGSFANADIERQGWLLTAATGGLVVSTLFRVIVAAHYVLWNWDVMTTVAEWSRFLAEYPGVSDGSWNIVAPLGFLPSYRMTVDGFAVVQAVFEPLGPVLACAVVVKLLLDEAGARLRYTEQQLEEVKE